MAWIWLVLASLLSCAGQLCQKQATRAGGGQQVALWLGLALLKLGGGRVGWGGGLAQVPGGEAETQVSQK